MQYKPRWGGKVDVNKRIDPVVKPAEYVPQEKLKAKFVPHGGTAKPANFYTGNNMIGIATMHKSNSVPVFNADAAIDLAQMRRN